MARKDRNSKKKGIKVDLSGVETAKKVIPEGQYTVKVEVAEIKHSDNSNSDYVAFTFEVTEGPNKGSKLFHNCSLQPQALFNLKTVLLALGFDIPGKAFDLDLEALIDLECVVEVTHEIYEGKKKARITDFINPEEADDSDDEDEDDEDEDEDDEDEEDGPDYDSMTQKELKALCKEKGIKTPKGMSKDDMIKELEALDEDDEEDDEDEDDDDSQDYSEMSLDELKAECKERGIKVPKKAKAAQLVELLEEDDEE